MLQLTLMPFQHLSAGSNHAAALSGASNGSGSISACARVLTSLGQLLVNGASIKESRQKEQVDAGSADVSSALSVPPAVAGGFSDEIVRSSDPPAIAGGTDLIPEKPLNA